MKILGLDIGSSSLKAGLVRAGKLQSEITRAAYSTHFDGAKVEVNPQDVLKAIRQAIHDLGRLAGHADAINFSVMSPAWIAMDARGKPLTPFVTHQDRRSTDIALKLLKKVGRDKFLKVAGNLPFPGSISITTAAWYAENFPGLMRKADLVGHLNTFLHRQLTGQRVIDLSNASFTGLYETTKLGGWSRELCAAAGLSTSKLPRIFESNVIAGHITREAARAFGLTEGTPVMAGIIDTSSAVFVTGPKAGRLLNVSGSTDVLSLCTPKPHPHGNLLTRALGIGKWWLSVGTIAAAGSSINWVQKQLFADLKSEEFYKLMAKLCRHSKEHPADERSVQFAPYLAGQRASMEQKKGAFTNLTLATTREDMLMAVIDALASASAERLHHLASHGVNISHAVVTSGGTAKALHDVLYRDWKGKWTFHPIQEASLRGLSCVTPVNA
jgi:xylulokinase